MEESCPWIRPGVIRLKRSGYPGAPPVEQPRAARIPVSMEFENASK